MAVSKTTDLGTSWQRMLVTSRTGFTYALALVPANSSIVYAGGSDSSQAGLYKSTNGGSSWASAGAGLTGVVIAIAINPTATNILYAGSRNGVFKSTDSGTSWTNTGCSDVRALLVDPGNPNVVYVGTGSGVYRSTTGGGSWMAMNQGLQDLNVTCIGMNPVSYLFAGTYAAGVHRWLFTGIAENTGSTPRSGFAVKPNPTAGKSMISYALPRAGKVRLVLYDNQGRLVKTLVTAVQDAGIHSIACHADQLAAGVYFLELVTSETQTRQKLIIIK